MIILLKGGNTMSSNCSILIIGGDARYLEVINQLSAEGATCYLVGFDQLTFELSNVHHSKLEKIEFNIIDFILLPVSGTGSKGKIETAYSNETVYLTKEMIGQTPEHCIICTGISNSFLDHATKTTNRKLIRLFARDDLAVYNSIPTAEGALMLAMEQTDITIHGSRVMVLGFGRVGMTVARLFSSVGAKVSVCVRKSADIARITEMGLHPILIKDLEQEITKLAICINTIPHPVIDYKLISAMNTTTLIIDLASDPGGTDFAFAKKKGIKALHALGLPGKVAPKTAGKIIAEVFVDVITHEIM